MIRAIKQIAAVPAVVDDIGEVMREDMLFALDDNGVVWMMVDVQAGGDWVRLPDLPGAPAVPTGPRIPTREELEAEARDE